MDAVIEQELQTSISSYFWGRTITNNARRLGEELAPFLLEHYDITPK